MYRLRRASEQRIPQTSLLLPEVRKVPYKKIRSCNIYARPVARSSRHSIYFMPWWLRNSQWYFGYIYTNELCGLPLRCTMDYCTLTPCILSYIVLVFTECYHAMWVVYPGWYSVFLQYSVLMYILYVMWNLTFTVASNKYLTRTCSNDVA